MLTSRFGAAAGAVLSLAMTTGCHEEFELQPYQLPNDQGYRHITSIMNPNDNDELIIFGGLGNGGPQPPTPMNYNVYSLDLDEEPADREWQLASTDSEVDRPWFTSTNGFVEIEGDHYLACDDTDENAVYSFDPASYQFQELSTSTLPVTINAGDCCAAGVRVAEEADGQTVYDDRIYIFGGRNDYASPVPYVRYYSVTHDRWQRVADLHEGRSHLGCAAIERNGEPTLYVVGGGNSPAGTALRSLERYDIEADSWTLYEDFLPAGRTRMAIEPFADRFLVLVGGDSSCAGGGPSNSCTSDQPLTVVDVVDVESHRLLPSEWIPQLNEPRQTPGVALRTTASSYELYVVGGRTRDASGLGVLTSTEVLTFERSRDKPHGHALGHLRGR